MFSLFAGRRAWIAFSAIALLITPQLMPAQTPDTPNDERIKQANLELLHKLQKTVTLERGIDHKTQLKDALEFLRDRYNITFLLDRPAFKRGPQQKPIDIAPVEMPRTKDVGLDTILWLLLKQQGATYEIKRGIVHVVPASRAPRTILPRTPRQKEAAKAVREKLKTPINLPNGVDANTPLKDLLEFLGDVGQINIVVDFQAFKERRIEVMEDQPVKLPKLVGVPLAKVLEMVLKQVGGGTYEIPDNLLLIVPPPDKVES